MVYSRKLNFHSNCTNPLPPSPEHQVHHVNGVLAEEAVLDGEYCFHSRAEEKKQARYVRLRFTLECLWQKTGKLERSRILASD